MTPKMSAKQGEHWEIMAFEMSRKRAQALWENDTCQDCNYPLDECECDKCTFCGFPYPCNCVAAEVTRRLRLDFYSLVEEEQD